MEFVYNSEYWLISTFIDSSIIDGKLKSIEIEEIIKHFLSNLKKEDIYYKIREQFGEFLIDMAKNISFSCKWIPYLENFPYEDENSQKKYDTLGYFQFDVEYYKNEPSKKEKIRSNFIQQFPQLILPLLGKFSKKPENRGIYFDLESPMYVFVTSYETKPDEVMWTQENINKF